MQDVGSLNPKETVMTPFEKAEKNLLSFADRALFSYQLNELLEMSNHLERVSRLNKSNDSEDDAASLLRDIRSEKIADELEAVNLAIEILLKSYQYNELEA